MPLAQQGPMATGCRITLVFEGGIPEVTAAEVKALLDPLVDFRAKSSSEAYANTLPPKVREAVEAHEILVGMNRRMVLASMGEPKTKEREHTSSTEEDSPMYEEWIYGDPPKPTQFVRFKNGHVVRLEIAAIGKPIEVHDKDEIGGPPEPTLEARTIVNGDVQPTADGDHNGAAAPTLRKPGEVLDGPNAVPGLGKVKMPADQQPQQSPTAQQTPAAQPQPQTSTPPASDTPKQQLTTAASR
jgi:predicted component of type VI protein secretion system